MFLDEESANDRLNSSENLLNDLSDLLKDESDSQSSSKESHQETEISDKDTMRLLDEALNPDDYKRRGRGKEKTYEERADIGLIATLTSTNQAAEMFGISTGQTANHRNGKTNFYDDVDPPLKKKLRIKLDEIADISADKLLSVLNIVDEESIENLRGSAIKATQVAMNLGRIIEKVSPKQEEDNRDRTIFVLMQPNMAREEDYDVIDLK